MDKLILLVEPTSVNLSMARSLLQVLMRGDRERVDIVVVSHNNIPLHPPWHEVEHILEHEIRSIIAASPELALEAMEAGIPIINYQPNAIISSQISKLAGDIQAIAKTH
jgi:Flp pilus assembly CpaE family ATPase